MSKALIATLEEFRQRNGEPLKVLFVNTGGTFSCLPNKEGLLEPIQSSEQLRILLGDGLNLDFLIKKGLLDLQLRHVFAIDSSQVTNEHRDKMIEAIKPEYGDTDGVIVLHGTDTAADTAKYLHLAFSYYDPRSIAGNEPREFNWMKPIIVLSSQIPSVESLADKLSHRIDSDGPMNLSLAIMTIADQKIGEAGLITNGGDLLRGCATQKGAEVDIPPFYSDPGVPEVAKFTALGLRYISHGFLQQTTDGLLSPFVISHASKYDSKIITVQESSHLNLLRSFFSSDKETQEKLRPYLPEVLIYISKGAGNVMEDDYDIIKKAEEIGIVAFRVPIPGGRIPTMQIYDVPGHDIPAINIQPQTAFFKSMMTLYLVDTMKIQKKEKTIFIVKMMKAVWSNEFLPRR